MAARADDESTIGGINVTPLIDITLVLLVAFIAVANAEVRQAIPMDTPRAAPRDAPELVLAVVLRADGTTEVDGRPITDDAALLERASAARRRGEARAVIRADRAVCHGRVVRAIDLVHQAGITRVALGALR